METKFSKFLNNSVINENTKHKTYKLFLSDIKKSLIGDFKHTREQSDEYINLYNDLFKKLWQNGFSPRESIVSTQRPGFKIDDDNITESNIINIDDDYDILLNDLLSNNNKSIINNINKYYERYSSIIYSDKRLTERVKNNYKNLLKIYKDKNDIKI